MKHVVAMCLAGTSLAAIASAASAQTAVPTEPPAPVAENSNKADNPEIIVTAQKRSERLLDVPQSVSVISGKSLENAHAQRLSDYLNRIPSSNVVESQAGSSRIVLRGINAGGVGATVATYIDETPFGSATSLANGGVLAPDLDPFDLSRVEVLRGPQGTLYGANSLGGLVKYVTVAPDPLQISAAGEIGLENVAHGSTGWWARAATNIPLSSDAAIRLSGFYRDQAGYTDNALFGLKDVNDGSAYGGRFSFLFRPTAGLRIRGSVVLQNIRSNGTNAVDVDPVTLRPVAGKYDQFRLVQEPNDIDYRLYNTTIDYDFGSVALVSATSYGTLDQSSAFDASGVYGPLLSSIFATPLGAAVDQSMKQRRFTQEVRLASSGSDVVEWTVGGFYTKEKNRLGQDLYGVDGITGERIDAFAGLVAVGLPSSYSEVAGFANATWHISPKFDVTGGGRYSHNKQSVKQDTDGLLAGGASVFEGNSSDNVFTYSVASTFKPNARTRVYARVAKGYRPGGPNAVSPLAPAGVPRQFGPDTTINYEVGVKTESDNRLITAEVTAFLIDWRDIQLLAQVEGFGVNTNGGSARSKGIEATFGLNPARGLSFYANGAYVDAYLTKDAPALVGGLEGDPLPYNPKWQSTIGGEYVHPLSAKVTARAGLSWHYTGSRKGDFSPGGQPKLRSFSQVDAHAGIDIGSFRIDAYVHNLTDARGILNVATMGPLDGNYAASLVRPRSFGLVLGARY